MQQKSTNIRFTILLAFFVIASISFGATNRRQLIYEAYVSSNRAQWVQIVSEMERSNEPKTVAWKLELMEYYYGMAGYYIGVKKKDLAAVIIAKGNTLIDGVLREQPKNATAMAYKGAFTAFKINLNRMKVMSLGRESLGWMEKALTADPENIQALADRGNAYVHAPALFGGDPEHGIILFRKGLAAMERKNQATGNWFYLHLLVTTADAYKRTERPEKARQYYERALQVEPHFRYVKETLLPALDKAL
jgi:tetratricopeptide (TPR) repeat protein